MKKQAQLDENGKRKFGIRDCVAYAAGDLGCNMSFGLKSTVQTFWLAYMMLETGLLSILLLIVQIWDAINDPVIGSLIDADKRNYKYGKFKTYVFWGAVGLLFAGALVFIPLPNAKIWIKATLFIVGYVFWDAFYTLANVPYGSMLSLITESSTERSSLSTWRSVGSIIGNMVPMILLPMLIWRKVTYDGTTDFLDKIVIPEGFENADFHTNPVTGKPYEMGEAVLNPATGQGMEILLGERMFWVALIMGVIGFLCFIFMLKNITLRVDDSTVKTNNTEKFNFFRAFGGFIKNRPAVGATIAAMGMFLGMQSAGTANTIMFATYFNKASLSGIVQVIGFLPMFLFMPFIKKIVDKFGKKEASGVGAFVSVIGGVLMFIFPMISNKTVALLVYILSLSVYGVGLGIYTCVSWALMGDAIDYNEWKNGKREEGVIYSIHSFFRKLAQGLGPSAVLLIMGLLGYNSKLGTIGQSVETAKNMCWLVSGLFLFSAVLMFVALAFVYNIDKKTLVEMNIALGRNIEGEDGAEIAEGVRTNLEEDGISEDISKEKDGEE